MAAPTDRAAQILEFIREEAVAVAPEEVSLDTYLLNGVLDSAGLALLPSFLEDTFDIRIPSDDVDEENFATPTTIERFVAYRVGPT